MQRVIDKELGVGGSKFQGFDKPRQNYFKMPNVWTDITARMRSLAELKVVEYVLRHTWGYQEYGGKKRITLDEFQKGRKRTDGSRMDCGIGMGKQAVVSGIKQAVEDGFLEEERDDTDKGRVKKCYSLTMVASDEPGEVEEEYENHTPDGLKSYPKGMKIIPRTEKETVERNLKKTVNGDQGIKPLKTLSNLDIPAEKAEYVANYVCQEMGDEHSVDFYRLVAWKVPERQIRQAIAEIKADGAKDPRKVFTHRMKMYAMKQNLRRL